MEGNLRHQESVCVFMHACVLCWTVLVDSHYPLVLDVCECACACVCVCVCVPMSVCVHVSVYAVYVRGCISAYFSLKTRP